MKNLLYTLAVTLWTIVLIQACAIQQADAVKLDSEAQRILCEIEAGQDQSEALSKDSLRLALSILDSLQMQEVNLGDMYFTANDTLGHLSR